MLKQTILGAVAVAAVACTGYGGVTRGYTTAPAVSPCPVEFSVDSIDFRKDLTRVYGRLSGRPHTSCRIDAATLSTPSGDLLANDIDGIDFERYFQWEDDGVILLEIDFAPAKEASAIKFNTVRGEAAFTIGR